MNIISIGTRFRNHSDLLNIVSILISILCICLSPTIFANETKKATQPSAKESDLGDNSQSKKNQKLQSTSTKKKSFTEKLESISKRQKEKVFETAVDFAKWVDDFFGEREGLESANYDYFRLSNNLIIQQGESPRFRPRIRAKVNLPQMNNRFSLLFSSQDDNSAGQFDNEDNTQDTRDTTNDKLSAALDYEVLAIEKSKLNFRVGLDSSFNSFVYMKHSMPLFESEKSRFMNYNYLLWEDDEGFGVASKLEFDRLIDEKNLFRWRYSVLRSEKSLGNEWKNRLTLINKFTEERWLAYELGAFGESESIYRVEDYRFSVRFRTYTDINWLFFEVEPEVRYQRNQETLEREIVPGITLRWEIKFEN